jgi:hypothetical protein
MRLPFFLQVVCRAEEIAIGGVRLSVSLPALRKNDFSVQSHAREL